MGTVDSIISSEALQLNFLVCDSHGCPKRNMHIKILGFAAFALLATAGTASAGTANCKQKDAVCGTEDANGYNKMLKNCWKTGLLDDGCKITSKKIGAFDWHSACCKKCKDDNTPTKPGEQNGYLEWLKKRNDDGTLTPKISC